MTFIEAIELLNQGKRVRNTRWIKGHYIERGNYGNIICQDRELYSPNITNIFGQWEELN